jgi:DNA-binding response OmpR family regulator
MTKGRELAMKALIAESNHEESDNIVMALNLCFPNLELITADTGKQCLDMVRDNNLDIVILGDLADMTDFDVIEQIHDCSDVPVIALSNASDKHILLKAFDKGADDYMTKPFHQLELVARVRALIRRSKSPMGFSR